MGSLRHAVLVLVLGGGAGCRFHRASTTTASPDGALAVDGAGGELDGSANTAGDAPPPCPASYSAQHYRLIATAGLWLDAEAACEADAPGSTHLVVLDDDTERAAVATLIQALPTDAWVGLVRDPGGSYPWSWHEVTGEQASYTPFEATEPNNMSGNQYVAAMRKSSGYLYDYGVDQQLDAVCECDQRPAVNADYNPNTP